MRTLILALALAAVLATSAFAGGYNLGTGTSAGISADGAYVVANLSSVATLVNVSTGGTTSLGGYTAAGVATRIKNSAYQILVAGNANGNVNVWKSDTAAWSVIGVGTGLCIDADQTPTGSINYWIGGNQGTTTGSRVAYRYKESSASWSSLGLPANYNKDAYIYGISQIGSYAGRAQFGGVSGGGARGAVGGGTLTGLNPIIGAQTTANEAVANAISRDGYVAGGWSTFAGGARGLTLWSLRPTVNPTPIAQLPFLAVGDNYGEVQCLNADGTIAAGYSRYVGTPANTNANAFIWDAVNGTRSISSVISGWGFDTTGWTAFSAVTGMSGDGKVLCGNGTYGGVTTSWVAFQPVPEPGSILALSMGLVGLIGLRRRGK